MPGQAAVPSTNGPMAHSVDELELWAKTVVDSKPWQRDASVVPIPWRLVNEPLPAKLAFGILYDDGVSRPFPPILRALRETVDKLRKMGHVVIEWDNREHAYGAKLLRRLYTADGGKTIAGLMKESGGPWPEGLKAWKEASEDSSRDLVRILYPVTPGD